MSAATWDERKAIHAEVQIIGGVALDGDVGGGVVDSVIAAGCDANSKKAGTSEDAGSSQQQAQEAPVSDSHTAVPPLVHPVPDFKPEQGDATSQSFDETGEHDVVSSNDPGDLDIPDFLR